MTRKQSPSQGRLIGGNSWIVEPRRLEEFVQAEEKTSPDKTVVKRWIASAPAKPSR